MFPRANDVSTKLQAQIAHRLMPDAAREGYEAAATANITTTGLIVHGTHGQYSSMPPPSRAYPQLGIDALCDPDHDFSCIGDVRRSGCLMQPRILGEFGAMPAQGLLRGLEFPNGGIGGGFGSGGRI